MKYEINNNTIQISVNSFGAQLSSLKKIAKNLEYLWQANPLYWNRHAPILFPIVGRLKEDYYCYNHQKYTLGQHGFARDNEFTLIKQSNDFLEFKLSHTKELLKTYPFFFELLVSYALIENKLVITYKVLNQSSETMLFSIGAHPAFNWPLDNENKDDYYLEFDTITTTQRYFLNQEGLVYKKEPLTIVDNKIALNETLFKEDALIFNDATLQKISLKNTKNSHSITVDFKDFPYVGIWSKPNGAPFICIEPWLGIADDENSTHRIEEKKGIIALEKEGSFLCSYSIEVF